MKETLRLGYKQTEVGVIPEDWDLPLLDSIAKRGSGHTPDKKHPEYWNGPIKWVSLRDSDSLDNVFIEETAATITAAGIANSSAVIHPAGTVVLSRDAGVGKSAIIKTEMAVSQHFMAWQCGANLDNIYLYYWLQAAKPEFERIAMGNTIKTIGLPFFRNLRIAQPPLPEQRAIAAALSDVDDLLAKLDQLIAKKRDLKQAAMQQFLTGHTRLPGFSGAWEVKPVFSFSDLVTKGATPTTYGFKWVDDGVLFLRSECVATDGLDLTQSMFITEEAHAALRRGEVRAGDILMTITGNVGRVVRLSSEFDVGNINQHIARIRVKDPNVCSDFVFHWLSQEDVRKNYTLITTGQAYPQISLKQVRETLVPIPIFEEQTAIATVLSDMDADIAALEARRDKTRALKQGMMQELLTGRIRLV